MNLKVIIAGILALVGIVAGLLKYQSSVDLDKKEDLKKLRSMNDLFMVE